LNIAILAVGNEILGGKIIDTNGAFISKEIELLGARVTHREIVSDEIEDILKGLSHCFEYADFVITIGGLGPTLDDLTRIAVAGYFNEKLIQNHALVKEIENYFTSTGRVMTKNNERQAQVFELGQVLKNPNGTAPGLSLTKKNKSIYLLPGPPNELIPMFQTYVRPEIAKRIDEPLLKRTFRLYGVGESLAEVKLKPILNKYFMLDTAPYASISYIDYIVTGSSQIKDRLDDFEKEFLVIMEEFYVGNGETSLVEQIVQLLQEKNLTISLAESCTGGLLASEFVSVAGVSDVFTEGVVVYSNDAKIRRLGVGENLLTTFGAVSSECAKEMAQQLIKQNNSDIAISITGIAGPGGATKEKPIGLVYICLIVNNQVYLHEMYFKGSRDRVRMRAKDHALYLLYRILTTEL